MVILMWSSARLFAGVWAILPSMAVMLVERSLIAARWAWPVAVANPALAARDVVLMAIVTGDDDQQFMAARLSAVQRHCDAEGYIVGGGVQLMRPEVFW